MQEFEASLHGSDLLWDMAGKQKERTRHMYVG